MSETYRDRVLSVIPASGTFTMHDVNRMLKAKKLFVPTGNNGISRVAKELRKDGIIVLVRKDGRNVNVWRRT